MSLRDGSLRGLEVLMFGKKRNRQDGQDDPFQAPRPERPYSGPLVGAMNAENPPTETPPTTPLYAGNLPAHAGDAVDDDRFMSNLTADLEAQADTSDATDHAPVAAEPEDTLPQATSHTEPIAPKESADEPMQQVQTPAQRLKGSRELTRDGDQMLGLLSTIEAQLGELQRLRADRETLIGDLELAQEELDTQRALLDEREQNIAALEEEARENQRITEGMLAQAETRGRELDETRADLESQRTRLEQLQSELDHKDRELREREEILRSGLEELQSREESADARERELREQIAAQAELQIAETRTSLDEARSEIDSLRTRLDEYAGEIERAHSEADQRVAAAEHALRAELAEQAQQVQRSSDDRVRDLQAQLDAIQNELEQARAAATQHQDHCERLNVQVGELESKLAQAQQAVSEHGAQAEATESVERRVSELESELAKTRTQLAEAGKHLSEAQDRAAEAERQATAAAQIADQARAEMESIRSQSASMPAAQPADLEAANQAAKAEITKRDRAIELLKTRLDQTIEKCKQLDAQLKAAPASPLSGNNELDELQHKLLSRQQELDVLAHKLSAREQAVKQRETAAKGGGSAPMSGMSGGMLDAERDALRKEAEQLHQQREAVAEMKAKLEQSAKQVAAKASKGRAATVLLSAVVTMAILALGAWYTAGQFAQPVHVASVELGVDPQAQLSERQLASWQSYHEALLEDPQFHELAARRLKSRGYHEFGTPSDVRSMVQEGMIGSESSRAGRLTLIYTGAGSDRTSRVLDTFSSALSSFANDVRDHRHDGAATAIVTPVSADPTPIEDPRLNLFAMIFGGLCAFALFASVILCRRLSRDMADFEGRLVDPMNFDRIDSTMTEGGASTEGKRLMF